MTFINEWKLANYILSHESPINKSEAGLVNSAWCRLAPRAGLVAVRESWHSWKYHFTDTTIPWAKKITAGGKPSQLSDRFLNGLASRDSSGVIHGMSDTPEYRVYYGILMRCLNPKEPGYPDYGGRGIQVCDRWKGSFQAFFEDMGKRPGSGYSIDRIDVNGDYCKENCRWATAFEQARNQRCSVRVTIGELTLTIGEWCDRLGIKYCTVRYRRKRKGMSLIEALTTPLGPTARRYGSRRKAGLL